MRISIAIEADAAPAVFIKTMARFGLLALGAGMAAAALALVPAPAGSQLISVYFLVFQDAPVLVLLGVFLLSAQGLLRRPLALTTPAWVSPKHARLIVWATVAAVAALVFAGTHFVCRDYGLSLDEFMAEFDSRIIAAGALMAPVADEWRDLVPALQPIFRLPVPDNAYWLSSYLPMNAAIRGAFLWLGDPTWASVSMAAIALTTLFAIARKLWPDRPDAAVVSVILLASSAQFLIAAMTPYAVTAHLCLNLVWLWLFLRDRWWGHLAAVLVAFVASGLHQVAFHPLFAAPFVFSLLFTRRWSLSVFYGGAYASIVLFWIFYWSLLIGTTTPSPAADVGLLSFVQRIGEISTLEAASVALMAINLLRFLAWQSPLMLPLALVGLTIGRNRSGILVSLALGIALTLAVVLVVMPFQGHGWGYRYLHGMLGSLALLAAQGWIWLSDRSANLRQQPAAILLLSIALSIFALLPWRLAQVYAFVGPYAAASAAIARSKAEVVVVDASNIWYGVDLVRNDPLLASSPKVLNLTSLRSDQIKQLCSRYRVAIFDSEDASRAGLPFASSQSPAAGSAERLRVLMRSLGCAKEHVTAANPPQS
jgi:hypothetical protein